MTNQLLRRLLTTEAQILTRERTGPEDEFGTPTWQTSTSTVMCHVQPASQADAEELQGPGTSLATSVGWFPAGTAITSADRIVLDFGVELEVVGAPRPWVNPRLGAVSHVIVGLVEAT